MDSQTGTAETSNNSLTAVQSLAEKAYGAIAEEMDNKTAEEIREYAEVFWERIEELENYTKILNTIEAGEEKNRKTQKMQALLRKKIEMYKVPITQMKIHYTVSTTNKKVYTEEEDRFLLVQLDRLGLDADELYERIREAIRESPLFRFDWFFLSRSAIELSRRCTTLLTAVEKELEGDSGKGSTKARDREEEEDEDESPPAKKPKTVTANGTKNGTKNGPKVSRA